MKKGNSRMYNGSIRSKLSSFFDSRLNTKLFLVALACVWQTTYAQQISIPVDTVEAVVANCATADTGQLVISNTGGALLQYSLQLPLEVVLSNLNNNYTQVTGLIPSMYNFSEGSSGFFIVDGGNDMYDDGNYLSTDKGEYLYYSDNCRRHRQHRIFQD